MRLVGWIGFIHIACLLGWIVAHIVFGAMNPFGPLDSDLSLAEMGIRYWSEHGGMVGFDHGSKAFVFLVSIIIPVMLFGRFRQAAQRPETQQSATLQQPWNMLGLIAGVLGFLVLAISFMLQAVAVEYAFKLFAAASDEMSRRFALHFYEWAMLEGGLSVSFYLLAHVLVAGWVGLHSYGLLRQEQAKGLARLGFVYSGLQVLTVLVGWLFLMQGEQILHTVDEAVGLLFLVWLGLLSWRLLKRTPSAPALEYSS